jgi:mono/diheme cytochrome c family protein
MRISMYFVARASALLELPAAAIILTISCGALGAAETSLERGRYLVNGIVACGNCHTPKGAEMQALPNMELSGGVVFDAPVFHAVAGNITPDDKTGIGSWTDEQIANSIRNGTRPDGSIIGPPMPIQLYRNMSDTDVLAIVAYLRSVKPISRPVEKSSYKIPLPVSYGPPVMHVDDPPKDGGAHYGQYLANIGHCMECHTPVVDGRLDMTRLGAGGRELSAGPLGIVVSSNLTPANPDGIGHWTDSQVKETIASGLRPDGRHLIRLMAFDWYENISSGDLDALVKYLRTLKPVTR